MLPVRICGYQFKTYQFKQNIVKHKNIFLWHAFYDSMYAINGKILSEIVIMIVFLQVS